MALRSQSEVVGEDADRANEALATFIKQYLNAKKGQAAVTGIRQGGKIDAAIRLLSNFLSLKFITFNIPLQIAAVVGETAAKVPVLGARGLALANTRRLLPQGRAILKKYTYFTGESVLSEVLQPGRNIEENIGSVMYGLFQWNRVHTFQDLILGNMTAEEYKAGAISDERLAQIKVAAGRWLDLPWAKSVLGSTSAGAAVTKFRGWAIPIFTSTAEDALALARTLTRLG